MARILVVDDDPDIRLLLRYELAPEGYDVVEAEHGAAALECLGGAPIDLMLLDIMMPVVDGWEVLRRLDRSTAPPVLVITAGQNGSHVAELLEEGALDVILKPFDMEWMLRLIDAVLLVEQDEREEYRRRRIAQARREG